jgi:hypothetical protein
VNVGNGKNERPEVQPSVERIIAAGNSESESLSRTDRRRREPQPEHQRCVVDVRRQ